MKKLTIFTGAGISAESGISTFRANDGLWANYRIEDVCTPEALSNNRQKVIEFYNMRRKEVLTKQPNAAHLGLKELEEHDDWEQKMDARHIDPNVPTVVLAGNPLHVIEKSATDGVTELFNRLTV